jgi:hypothetical protein
VRPGSFNRARFARDGSLGLFTAVNAAGDGHVLHWEQDAAGELVLRRRVKAIASPITSFDIGSSGRLLVLGTSEGAVDDFPMRLPVNMFVCPSVCLSVCLLE